MEHPRHSQGQIDPGSHVETVGPIGPDSYRPRRLSRGSLRRIQAKISTVADAHCPPLEVMDVLGLAVEGLSKQVFATDLPEGPLHYGEFLGTLRNALFTVLLVHPTAAQKAGLLPESPTSSNSRDQFEHAYGIFLNWGRTVLNPAVREYLESPRKLDSRKRLDVIVLQWNGVLRDEALRIDRAVLRAQLRYKLGATIGESGVGSEELRGGQLRWWIRQMLEQAGPQASLLERSGSDLVLNQKRSRRAIVERFGKGTHRKSPRSLHDAGSRSGSAELADLLSQDREPHALERAAASDLRELRDALDQDRLVRVAADAALKQGNPSDIWEMLGETERVVGVLRGAKNPALKAAVVFAWSRPSRCKSHGGWTKEQVAHDYGVTARQLDGRLEQAERLLAALQHSA